MSADSKEAVVFFVDDDDSVRGVYSAILRKRGHTVLEAASAEEASRLAEVYADPIDVLLMDVNLPDGWGATLAQRLHESHPEMVVVFTTGYADVDPILSSALNEAEHVLRKPFNSEQLTKAIAAAMASRSH